MSTRRSKYCCGSYTVHLLFSGGCLTSALRHHFTVYHGLVTAHFYSCFRHAIHQPSGPPIFGDYPVILERFLSLNLSDLLIFEFHRCRGWAAALNEAIAIPVHFRRGLFPVSPSAFIGRARHVRRLSSGRIIVRYNRWLLLFPAPRDTRGERQAQARTLISKSLVTQWAWNQSALCVRSMGFTI